MFVYRLSPPLSLPFPRYFSPNREPVHRLTITSFTVNGSVNAARSSCRRKFHGKGIKLKTFAPSYVISFPGVVVSSLWTGLWSSGELPFPCYFFPQKEPRACSQAKWLGVVASSRRYRVRVLLSSFFSSFFFSLFVLLFSINISWITVI